MGNGISTQLLCKNSKKSKNINTPLKIVTLWSFELNYSSTLVAQSMPLSYLGVDSYEPWWGWLGLASATLRVGFGPSRLPSKRGALRWALPCRWRPLFISGRFVAWCACAKLGMRAASWHHAYCRGYDDSGRDVEGATRGPLPLAAWASCPLGEGGASAPVCDYPSAHFQVDK